MSEQAPPRLLSASPVFQVADVAATMRWYEQNLGFEVFPTVPPVPPSPTDGLSKTF